MNGNQKNAIKEHWSEIIGVFTVRPILLGFLTHLGLYPEIDSAETEYITNIKPTGTASIELLGLIQTIDIGWDALIEYLETKGHKGLADKLKTSCSERNKRMKTISADCTNQQSIEERLKDYYTREYSSVGTIFVCHKHVDEIWVPLKLDEKSRSPQQKNSFDHSGLLERLADKKSKGVAVVKGHPGMGKTTLVKKIAYEWANGKHSHLKLVLAVPLRHVGKTTDFRELATDYYGIEFTLSPDEKVELLNKLKQLGRDLLICLDGLDEYNSWSDSPFKNLFGTPFETNTEYIRSRPPPVPYTLLITSRPYAADITNPEFLPLRFEIAPLDKQRLNDFIKLYCETENGVQKVNQYLSSNAELVIQVPLVLTFVCYLADSENEIPINLTLLYKSLVISLLDHAVKHGKLSENGRWEDSAAIKTSAKLAFDGCKEHTFEFLQKDPEELKNSLACGFLLHRNDVNVKKADFPHRSIQEFFAAFYCSQLILTPDRTERNFIVQEILNNDSLFGRFFLGICSDKKKFEEMLEWLNPTFDEMIENYPFDISDLLFLLSDSLSCCSEADAKLLGKRLADSLDQLEMKAGDKLRMERNYNRRMHRFSFNKSFQAGLNLNFLSDERYYTHWSLCHGGDSNWSRLTHVSRRKWRFWNCAGVLSSV